MPIPSRARALQITLILMLWVAVRFPTTTAAQEPLDLEFSGGGSFARNGGANWLGWNVGVVTYLKSDLNVEVEVSRSSTSQFQPYGFSYQLRQHTYTILAGPRLTGWKVRNMQTYIHLIFGAAISHYEYTYSSDPTTPLTPPFDDTTMALSVGGGIDRRLKGPLIWRVAAIDYFGFGFEGRWASGLRLSTGLVLRFSRK